MSAEFPPFSSRPASLSEAEAVICEAQALITRLQQKLQFSELRVMALEEQLRLRRIEKYGAGSEKLSNLQLELLEREPGVSREEVQAESERAVLAGEATQVLVRQRQPRRPASWTPDVAPGVAAGGAGDCLRAGTVCVRPLRASDFGDRL